MSNLTFNDDQVADRIRSGTAAKESIVSITDVLCEGPIEGLVEGTSSVFLNDTSMADGRLRQFSPSVSQISTATDDVAHATIVFSGSSAGTVNSSSVIPDDLITASSSDTDNPRYLGIPKLI